MTEESNKNQEVKEEATKDQLSEEQLENVQGGSTNKRPRCPGTADMIRGDLPVIN